MVTGGQTARGFPMVALGRRRFVQLAAAAVVARAQQAPKPLRLGVVVDCTNADAGIRRVKELGFATCEVKVAAYDGGAAKKLRAALEQYGIEATALIVTGPGPEIDTFQDGPHTVGLVPPKTRGDRVELLRKASDFAKTAGIPAVQRELGFLPAEVDNPLFKPCVDALWHVADYCKHNGQTVRCATGHETPLALLRVIRAAAFPNIGVNLNPASLIRYGNGNPVDALDTLGPLVMGVSSVGESHQKTGIGDSPHFREKPLRAERSAGPSMAPARRRNGLLGDFRALSSSIRMMAPRDIPVF